MVYVSCINLCINIARYYEFNFGDDSSLTPNICINSCDVHSSGSVEVQNFKTKNILTLKLKKSEQVKINKENSENR